MGIKTYNPYTPSRRQMTGSDFSEITKTTPEKSLLDSKKRKAGRNAQGKITVRHRGGGAKKKYRIVDFKRKKDGIPAKGNRYRVRSEQKREHRTDLLCRRREGLHPCSGRTERRHDSYERRRRRGKSRKLPSAFRDPGWYSGTQH